MSTVMSPTVNKKSGKGKFDDEDRSARLTANKGD